MKAEPYVAAPPSLGVVGPKTLPNSRGAIVVRLGSEHKSNHRSFGPEFDALSPEGLGHKGGAYVQPAEEVPLEFAFLRWRAACKALL